MSTMIEAKRTTTKGPWLNEPIEVCFKHCGLLCVMLREDTLSHWRGYVRLPKMTEPTNFDSYEKCDQILDVHGGITFADGVPRDQRPDEHWVGFDCAHYMDFVPKYEHFGVSLGDDPTQWRDVNYVRSETERLAVQVSRLTAGRRI
ncbi:hypothetical protein [Nitrospira sp. BLG_1]|uniref:hypothetical protein n=1 Tax=Nitrospira sp. BLG_1 TaxID=3395883 RepID=UPI0039BCA038